ncbi:MAG: signal peptidase II [Deltaproteobacteria bacterium]|nr:signal peptidase II [Deltaproteobacteria bacterium]
MVSKRMVFLPAIIVVLALDQVGKQHVVQTLGLGERVPLLGDLLALTHVPSAGGALGVFRDWLPGAQLIGFALLSTAATLLVLSFYRRLAPGEQGAATALGAILGGIASNGIDRLRYGSGLDFLHLGSTSADALPDFNLADVAIVLGVVTLIVELLATEMAARASERPRS